MISALVERVVRLLSKPKIYWEAARGEPGEIKDLAPYMLLLAAIPALATSIGVLVSFGRLGFIVAGIGAALATLLVQYLVSVGTWIGFGYIIDALAPHFGARKDIQQAMKLATGTIMPMWLGQALSLTGLHALGTLGALGGLGYGCYLLHLGLPIMNDTPRDKAVAYTVAAIACLIAAVIAVAILTCIPRACCLGTSVLVAR